MYLSSVFEASFGEGLQRADAAELGIMHNREIHRTIICGGGRHLFITVFMCKFTVISSTAIIWMTFLVWSKWRDRKMIKSLQLQLVLPHVIYRNKIIFFFACCPPLRQPCWGSICTACFIFTGLFSGATLDSVLLMLLLFMSLNKVTYQQLRSICCSKSTQ